MRKKLSIVLLGGILLPTCVWSQSYDRKNTWGYVFDGHKPDEVVVKPYGGTRTELSVARYKNNGGTIEEAYDDQVIFLYNPKSKRFLYSDGSWGTEAVGRYDGFGMPFNLVDPTGEGSPVNNLACKSKVKYGFYCEAFEQGHYLGRDGAYWVGAPTYLGSEGQANNARFFVDRGGAFVGGNFDPKLKGEFVYDNNNTDPNIVRGEWDNTLTWNFEEVEGIEYDNPEHPKLYRLYLYMPNKTVDKKKDVDTNNFLKHYVKLDSIDVFNDTHGYYMLTTARANQPDGDIGPGENMKENDQLTGDDYVAGTTNTGGAKIANDDASYYWQIVTRRDLKQKFLLDFEDPYTVEPVVGNATFNIDNPDFSRSLETTVNPNEPTDNPPAFWKESEDKVYTFEKGIYENAAFGRFTIMHPNNDGSLTQTIKPYQYGLFQLDIQGFTYGENETLNATLALTENSDGITVSSPVSVDKIKTEDADKIRNRIHEMALASTNDYDRNFIHDGHGTSNLYKKDPNYTPAPTEAHNDNGHWNDNDALIITTGADGKINGATGIKNSWGDQVKGLYCVKHYDEYERTAIGIYINGEGESKEAWYRKKLRGEDTWPEEWIQFNDGVIDVNIGDQIQFGPNVPRQNAANNENGTHHWWTPNNDWTGEREFILTVDYDSEGDYILTHQNSNDDKWTYAYYRLRVHAPGFDTPEADHVNFSNNKPVIIEKDRTGVSENQDGSIAFTITEGNDHGIKTIADYQHTAAEHDVYYVERAVGEFLYDSKNGDNYTKTVFFYVQGDDYKLDDIKISLEFSGIDNDYLNNFIAIDNMRLTYKGDTPFILDQHNKITTSAEPVSVNSLIPVYMNREFTAGAWNAFVCPIPLNVNQVRNAFGDGVQLSEIDEDGLFKDNPYVIKFTSIDVTAEDPQDTADPVEREAREEKLLEQVVLPGHFYLVKPSAVNYKSSVAQIDKNTYAIKAYDDEHDIVEGNPNYGTGKFVPLGNHDLRKPKYNSSDDKLLEGGEALVPTNGTKVYSEDGKTYTWADDFANWDPYAAGNSRYAGYSKLAPIASGNSPYRPFYTERYKSGQDVKHNAIELYGSYAPQTIAGSTSADSDAGKFRGNCYVFQTKSDGETGQTRLVHLNAKGNAVELPGFRFFIHDIEADETDANGAKPFTFVVDGVEDDDEFSGINSAVSVAADNGDIYTIAGQKVTGKLLKGVYVKNGKKFLVK